MNRIGSLILAGITLAALSGAALAENPYFRYDADSRITLDASVPSASVDAIVDQPVNIDGSSLIAAPPGSTWSVSSGSLPPGLHLDSLSGVIDGSPDASGTWSVQLLAEGSASSATLDLTIVVTQTQQPPEPATTISLATTAQLAGTVGDDFSYDFTPLATFTNGAPTLAWSSADLAVPGLALGPSSGVLSGKPTTAGTYGFTVKAADSSDPAVVPGQQTYSIKIDTPAGPVMLTGVVQMVQGTSHACFLQTGGIVKCVGANSFGQLGDGTNVAKAVPVQIHALDGATAISGAGNTTCAILSGKALCWGSGRYGNIGDGFMDDRNVPTQVSGLTSGVTKIAMGSKHGCAVKANTLQCWGNGGDGQALNGTYTPMNKTPVTAISVPSGTITNLAVGDDTSCITTSSSYFLYCGGGNQMGKAGLGGLVPKSSLLAGVDGTSDTISKIGLGYTFGCAFSSTNGYVYCWGENGSGQLGTTGQVYYTAHRVYGVYGVTDLAVGDAHACVIANGAVWCWGAAPGSASASNVFDPVRIPGLTSGVAKLFAGGNQTCAVMTSGGTKCWGVNDNHQLMDNTTTNRTSPVDAYDTPLN